MRKTIKNFMFIKRKRDSDDDDSSRYSNNRGCGGI